MGLLALRVEGLGKQYELRPPGGRYDTLRDVVSRLSRPAALWRALRAPREQFWALRDVGFDVEQGEVVGVIGRNGAGKSTLLKILSNITAPTEGQVKIWGTVGSLLEVGTGFHPELTGRENIFLNGAILGMSQRDVSRRFDEIVAFAQVERFVDQPTKHYSSGMYTRLAFSVAAHMEAQVLIVDEVLAVGDADFQRRCLGKIEEVSAEGRTVLFVSHSMPTVTRLCKRVMLLEQGQLVDDGEPGTVIGRYLRGGASGGSAERSWSDRARAPGDEVARLRSVRVRTRDGALANEVDIRAPVFVDVDFWNSAQDVKPSVNLHFYNDDGTCLFVSNDFNSPEWKKSARKPGLVRSTCEIPGNFLAEGRVVVWAAVSSYRPTVVHALEKDAVAFQVVDRTDGDGVRGPYAGEWPGAVRPMLTWNLQDELAET